MWDLTRIQTLILYFIVIWYLMMPFTKSFSLGKFGQIDLNLSRLMGIIVVIMCSALIPFMIRETKSFRLLFSAFLLIVLCFANVFIDTIPQKTITVFIRIYGGVLLLLFFAPSMSAINVVKIRKCITLIATATAIFTVIQFILIKISFSLAVKIFGIDSFWMGTEIIRPRGLIESVGGSAAVMTTGLLCIFFNSLKGKVRISDYLLISIIVFGLLLNFTRTYVFLIPIFIFINLTAYKRYTKSIGLAFLFLAVLGVSIGIIGLNTVNERFDDLPGFNSGNVKRQNLFMGRVELFEDVWSEFLNNDVINKLIGSGLNWTGNTLKKKYGIEASTHNDFVWLIGNLGILGCLVYLLFLFSILTSYKNTDKFFFIATCFYFS